MPRLSLWTTAICNALWIKDLRKNVRHACSLSYGDALYEFETGIRDPVTEIAHLSGSLPDVFRVCVPSSRRP